MTRRLLLLLLGRVLLLPRGLLLLRLRLALLGGRCRVRARRGRYRFRYRRRRPIARLQDTDAGLLERAVNLINMLPVGGFQRAEHIDRGNVGTGEGSFVFDLLDARPGLSDQLGKAGKSAWPIADHRRKPAQAAVGDQPLFNHPGEHHRVDVAAGEQQHRWAAGQFRQTASHASRQRRGTGSFDHALFQFHQSQHGQRQLFLANAHHAVNPIAGNGKRPFAYGADRQAIGQRVPHRHGNRAACRQARR